MFNLLKDKLKSFVSSFSQKTEQAKGPEEKDGELETAPSPREEKPLEPKAPVLEEQHKAGSKPELREEQHKKPERKPERPVAPERKELQRPEAMPERKEPARKEPQRPAAMPERKEPMTREPERPAVIPERRERVREEPERFPEKKEPMQREERKPEERNKEPERKPEESKKIEARLSLESKVRGIISGEIEIKEKDVGQLLDTLNMSLLESDVAYEVAEKITSDIRARVVGMKVARGKSSETIREAVSGALRDVMAIEGPDLFAMAEKSEKPFKILVMGPNGAGKTTTMAKLARMLMDRGHTCVFSASDTFRAAAIEQTEHHANRLGIKAIEKGYGADPAAVAFDAVNYARSNKIDVVLIDSSGRQETNVNLVNEMKKMTRVVKPDLKLFIGESIAGNALVNQVRSFNEAVGVDGVILTKLDCDAKGGTALSVSSATGVPVLFVGVGQAYGDLRKFDPEFIVKQLMG